MIQLGAITDPTFEEKEYNGFEKFWLKYLNDKRDLPFVYLIAKIVLIMIPMAILLYMPFLPNYVWWPVAIVYFIISNFVFKGPFGLMFHCTAHRLFFKKKYKKANKFLTWFVGPFFGQTPETYYSHHIGMHHVENNLEHDESSTMEYQRDSFGGWLKYFGDFMVVGLYKLCGYFSKTNRKKLKRNVIVGEFTYILLCIGLSFVNFKATLVVFILSFLISRIIMMLGNWTQHAFIDADDPENLYKSSITTINVKYNHKCFNDGYHISHHLKPGLHWTDHPKHFLDNLDEYAKNDALIFDGLDFLKLFFCLMNKNYDKMANHYVDISGKYKTHDEVVAMLKSRTQKLKHASFVKQAA